MAQQLGDNDEQARTGQMKHSTESDVTAPTTRGDALVSEVDDLDAVCCHACGHDAATHVGGAASKSRVTQCGTCRGFYRGNCGPHDKAAQLFRRVGQKGKRQPKSGSQLWQCPGQ
jgi:hypothetical protein